MNDNNNILVDRVKYKGRFIKILMEMNEENVLTAVKFDSGASSTSKEYKSFLVISSALTDILSEGNRKRTDIAVRLNKLVAVDNYALDFAKKMVRERLPLS